MVVGEIEFDEQDRRFGIMALSMAQLDEACALAGVTSEDARTDPSANIRAAAALLSSFADQLAIDRASLGAWAPVVAEYSGIEVEQARSQYVHEEVFGALKKGVYTESVALEPLEVTPHYPLMDSSSTPGPDYSQAIWRPSPTHSSRPSGNSGKVQMVIIHSCEGAYSGCWSHLTKSSAKVSAHYVVNSTGSEISQLVLESRKAWHIGATYKCSRNDGVACNLDGVGSNSFTVGIEHAGYASQSSWDSGLLQTSAALTCDITEQYGISPDKWHIVAHGQLQPYNRTDPGPNWPWTQYISMVGSACGGAPPPDPPEDPPENPGDESEIVVDSNNAANGPLAAFEISGNWTASNNVAGYYNTGYFWRSTGSSSDLARFKVYLSGSKPMIVEAWWSAASDRSPTAPFVIYDASDQHLDTVYVDQRQSGGKWVQLGTYNLTAGWNTVALSRWTTAGDVVVADAVRVREAP
jgi:N-acetyl-anhydromuramyl-L-alanine amidase AmpD